jgi:flagellar motility protein MotE (MotC chaperone)
MEHGEKTGAGKRRRWWPRGVLIGVLVLKVALLGAWGHGAFASAKAAPEGHKKEAHAPKAAPAKASKTTPVAPPAASGRTRELLGALERRQAELEKRERELDQRAERLRILEEDVTSKLTALEEIEKRLAGAAKERRTGNAQAAESLAKIYAAMKPAAAAPILDQLDDQTVLTIFAGMKEKQVGEILPLMSRERAIVLTQGLVAHGRVSK